MTQIALLYPGSMGCALAEALAPLGHQLVSYLAGRSRRTHENADRARVRGLSTFEQLVDAADAVVSLVPPNAASRVAHRYATALRSSRRWTGVEPRPLFIDANSVAPATVVAIDKAVRGAGGRFVDGAFLGPSTPIGRKTLLLLSGPDARAAAEIFQSTIAVKMIGGTVGHASAVKMAIALVTKALTALFLEMSCAATKAGCLDATLEAMRQLYPGTMEFVERNLPTYRTHAGRRVIEMREVEAWLDELDQRGAMTRAATAVLECVSKAGLHGAAAPFDELLRHIVQREPLRAMA